MGQAIGNLDPEMVTVVDWEQSTLLWCYQQVYKVNGQHWVLGTYPTSRWAAGEVGGDYYELQLPVDLPPGTYRWGMSLYRTLPDAGWEDLKVAGGEREMPIGGSVEIRER